MNPHLRDAVRGAVRTVNTPIAKRRLARKLRTAPQPLKLEIGGLRPRPGWLITNVNAVARNYLDATIAWPFEAGSVSHLYADNVIEHITLQAGRAMLSEAFRCLRPGGLIRIVTPDIRAHVDLYLSGRPGLESGTAHHYRSIGLVTEHPVDLLRIPIASFKHHLGYVYDFEALEAELARAGFHSVTRCDLGTSQHAALQGLDQRLDSGNSQMAVEATR